ncbi:MAG: aminotransferase class I/II-fold pyridoxal phosphate-dependent enzyme, partial [Methanobacteriaceae archaeon]
AEKFKVENNMNVDAENIIATVGASEALYIGAQAFFDKGDEILIPSPGFLSYDACVKLSEAKSVPVELTIENDFKMKYDDVQEKINSKTKALIMNSPSNPTGAVMDKEDVKAIADLATDHDFLIISDEIYEKIIYNAKHYSPGAYSDNVITINGFSKTYAMTGLRIAYLTSSENIIEELLKVHQYNTACTSSIAQKGAYAALTGPQDYVNNMVKEFKKRRDFIVKSLNDLGLETSNCQGAFYVFPKIDNIANNDMEFVEKAASAGVITVPGSAFGKSSNMHVRMSYATSFEEIKEAMSRLETII